MTIRVSNPYFDDIHYSLSNGYVNTGEHQPQPTAAAWRVKQSFNDGTRIRDYYEYLNMGNEIKETIERMREPAAAPAPVPEAQPAKPAQPAPVKCPYCDAMTVPDADGKCEYCGAVIQ